MLKMLFVPLHSSLFLFLLFFFFFLSLFFTGAFTDEHVIQAPLGGSATFNLNITRDMKVSLAEWSRCPDHKVFVYSPNHGLTIVNNSYAGRLFAKSSHSIVLENLQESDFVTYCYKLSTFPDGSLQGKINLVKRTENGKNNIYLPQHNTRHAVCKLAKNKPIFVPTNNIL